jgi:DNA (cytosine-5)-methyltransferase 1
VPLIKTIHGIRKLTPKECFLFQGFPKNYKFPKISNGQLYKQAGNSVSVPVLHQISKNIMTVLNGGACPIKDQLF